MSRFAENATTWAEHGLVPDVVIRAGIRRLLAERLDEIHADDVERAGGELNAFVSAMRLADIAPLPQAANEQHYELPAEFFTAALGSHRKYSSCYWSEHVQSLDQAEEEALAITCSRAEIVNGASVLDLGCGWGSLSLWIAAQYPDCRITAVSNSHRQRQHLVAEAKRRGLHNINVLTCDMNVFEPPATYDRILSVEMLEHMRNYERLFARISSWLESDGRFFMHIFCHRRCAYAFEDKGHSDWMSRHFFAGGFMPGVDVPLHFQLDLQLQSRWIWDGRHYQKTANAWLANIDERKEAVITILRQTYGPEQAARRFGRWRIFFMACAELFGYSNGQEWFVAHYLFSRRDGS